MPRYPSNMPFSVETISLSMLVFIFVQIIHEHIFWTLTTGYKNTLLQKDWIPALWLPLPFFSQNTWDNQFSSVHHFPEPPSPNRPPHTHTPQVRSSPRVWSVHPNHKWWPWRFRADATRRLCTPCHEPWSCGKAWWSSNPRCSAFRPHLLTPHNW